MMIRHGQYLTSTLSIASVIGLLLLLFPLSTQTSSFSLSLDLNSSPDDQAFQSLDVFPNRTVFIQIFATDIGNASDISLRFEVDPAQVAFEGFVRSNIVSGSSALTSKDFANIGITLSTNSSSSGLIGTIHFRTTEAFSGTAIRLVRARLVRGGQTETVSLDLSVTLRLAKPPSPDFDRSGMVGIPDFLLFVDVFGSGRGQDTYDSKYDLDVDGEIGIPDFLLFVDSFGKVVNRAPVFTSVPPVMLSVDENTPSGQAIGNPISATDGDGNTLTYRLSGADAERFAIEESTGQIQTKGMYNFESQNRYSLTVHVSDGEGGEARLAVGIAIADIDEPPEQPAPPSVSAIAATSLTVIWTEPVNTGPEITDYDVQYRQADSDAFIDAEYEITSVVYDDTKKSMRLTDLSPNTEYDIRVRATNEEGTSAWSELSESTTSAPSLPPGGGSGGGGTPPPPSQQQPNAPQVTISADTTPLTEGEGVIFAVTASPAPTSPLTVNVDVSEDGSVINWGLGVQPGLLIEANESTGWFLVRTLDDNVVENNGSVTAKVATGTGYTVGSPSSASVTVQDNDPQVTISADATSAVTEGTAATFTITVSPVLTSDLTVSVNVSEDGDVISGTAPSSVTINANKSTATLTVNTDDDNVVENNSTVTAKVATGTGYYVGSPSSASVTVNDNDS